VPFQKTKDIDTIYEEVKDYDLVLSADAPLSDAVNRRLEQPVFGEFANTPRRLVRARYDTLEKRDLFVKAIHETDMTWKQASYLLDLVVDCWKHTGDPTEITDTHEDSPEVRRMLDIVQAPNSIYSKMQEYTVDEGLDVAVVGWHDFDELDKKVLPEDYDKVSIFGDSRFDLPEFRVFESATNLVESVRKNVTPENANRVAVVAERGSKKEKLIKSAFETDGIPYTDSTSIGDTDGLRTLFKLLRTAVSNERVKVSEIRPILRRMGLNEDVPLRKDERYLPHLEEDLPELQSLLSNIEDTTFSESLDRYEDISETDMEEVRDAVEEVGLLDENISDSSINRLRYYVDSYDIGGDTDVGGVLFADPSASIADRPLVFYIGISESWAADIPDRPWIDEDEMNEKHLKSFQILLQNGNDQYYMVQKAKAGEKVTPCFYLHELVDEDALSGKSIDGFTSFENHGRYTGSSNPEGEVFNAKELDIEPTEVETISQSSLNEFVKSPRSYFFDRVLDSPDNRYTVRGNVLHDLAEFYVNYPNFVRKKGLETFIQESLERMEPYVDILETPVLRTEFLNGAEAVLEYLDELEVSQETPPGYEKQGATNIFSEFYDRPIDSGATELWFKNEGVGGHGRVDLVVDENTLLDYKTGSKSNSAVKNTKVSTYDPEEADFQPILYLAHHRDATERDSGEDDLEFRLLYMLESVGDRISDSGDHSIEDDIVTVPYVDMEFGEYVASREAFDSLCEIGTINKSFDKMGYEPYREFFEEVDLPENSHDKELLRDELLEEFTEYVKDYVGDYKYVRNSCKSALGNIAGMRGKDRLFKEEMDEFSGFVQEQIESLNECRRTGFPLGEVDVEELRKEELILERTNRTEVGGGV
jgi:hypothetical protein